MNKHKLAFKFGFAVILFTSLLGAPIRANAGGTNDFPGRPDGFPGRPDVFPGQGGRPPRIAPSFRNRGVKFTTNADGEIQIVVTPATQAKFNQNAANMRTNPQVVANRQITTRNEKTIVFRVMALEDNPTNAQTELTKSLSESGLSANTIETFTQKIVALLVAKPSNVDVNQLNVDPNQINEAINSYNKIVTNSKSSVIRKLARNGDFREIRERLVELASGL